MTAPLTEDELQSIRERARIISDTPEKYLTEPAIDRAMLLKHIDAQAEALRASRDEAARLREKLTKETAFAVRLDNERQTYRDEAARLREPLGPDASGRDFADLLDAAHDELVTRGGGPLADCLRLKADEIRAALTPKTGETE